MLRLRESAGIFGATSTTEAANTHLTSQSSRLGALDGLRGLAAIGVVVFHGYPQIGFWMGSFVDLFFVISGFVITRMLINAPPGRQVSLRNFWIRRILRIWPVYFLVVGGGTLALFAIQLASARVVIPPDWWKNLLFVQFTEWYGPHDGAFVELFGRYPLWLAHSWSLAVEEQFYLAWPLLLLLLRGRWGWVVLCAALGLACLWANLAGWPPLTLATRSIGLAMGALFALVESRLRESPGGRAARDWVALACAAMLCAGLLHQAPLVAGYYAGDRSWQYLGPPSVTAKDMVAFASIYAGLIGCLIIYHDGLLARALSTRLLVYLGGLSYALYMFHFPLMAFFGRTGMGWPVLSHLGFADQLGYWFVLFASSHLSQRWFEKPFNQRKRDYPLYVPLSRP